MLIQQRWIWKTDYKKDFLAVYVLARAVAYGEDISLTVNDLARKQGIVLPSTVFDHASPHPPTMGFLLMPLACFGYRTAKAIWFGVEITSLIFSIYLISSIFRKPLAWKWVLGIALALQAWYPVILELSNGQVHGFLLLCLSGTWYAGGRGRPALAGALFGLGLLIKPIAWPVGFVFLARKDWRALGAAALTVLAGYGVVALWIGCAPLYAYLTQALPAVSNLYQNHPLNLSLWTIGHRLFQGTPAADFVGDRITIVPLVVSPWVGRIVSAGIPALVLLISWRALRRTRDLGGQISLAVCLGVLLNPFSWPHYYILALLPLAQAVHQLAGERFPKRETIYFLVIAFLLVPTPFDWKNLAFLLSGMRYDPGQVMVIHALPSLVILIPAFAVAGLGCWWLRDRGLHDDPNSSVPASLAPCPGGPARSGPRWGPGAGGDAAAKPGGRT
ncbi:MAG: glycosyltransferase family 87 protein [bacterium]